MKNITYNGPISYLKIGPTDMKRARKIPKELITFGQRLIFLRKEAGYSQRSLGDAIGMSHRMIAYYEIQGGCPPADVLLRLSDALGVTIDELCGRSSNGNKRKDTQQNHRLFKRFLQIRKLSSRNREAVLRMVDELAKTAG